MTHSSSTTLSLYVMAFESILLRVDILTSEVFPVGTVDEHFPHNISWTLYGRSHRFKLGNWPPYVRHCYCISIQSLPFHIVSIDVADSRNIFCIQKQHRPQHVNSIVGFELLELYSQWLERMADHLHRLNVLLIGYASLCMTHTWMCKDFMFSG